MNWQTLKITGTKETIKAKIAAEAKLPQCAKDFILAQVASLPGDSTIVSVTGYSCDYANAIHPGASTRNIQFTISSATL